MAKKSKIPAIAETIFILFYLVFIIIASIKFNSQIKYYFLAMALVLGIGDSFHLIPRIIKNIKGDYKNSEFYLGLGTQISSITMTIFYLFFIFLFDLNILENPRPMNITNLFDAFKVMFNEFTLNLKFDFSNLLPFLIYSCFIIRIILCLFPQNNWYHKEGNKKWALIRNIPFMLIGLFCIIVSAYNNEIYLALLVFLSFLFYLPVALFGKKNPKLGMLMIPKTICYILMLAYLL